MEINSLSGPPDRIGCACVYMDDAGSERMGVLRQWSHTGVAPVAIVEDLETRTPRAVDLGRVRFR